MEIKWGVCLVLFICEQTLRHLGMYNIDPCAGIVYTQTGIHDFLQTAMCNFVRVLN